MCYVYSNSTCTAISLQLCTHLYSTSVLCLYGVNRCVLGCIAVCQLAVCCGHVPLTSSRTLHTTPLILYVCMSQCYWQLHVTDHDPCCDGQLVQCYKATSEPLGGNLSIVQWHYHAEDTHAHTR